MDHLDRDVKRALELGYGVHYGRYKADYPHTRDLDEAEEEKPVPTKACVECGTEFPLTHKNKKYCSEECYRKHNDRARNSRRMRVPNGICYGCGVKLPEDRRRRIFCSDACANKLKKIKVKE